MKKLKVKDEPLEILNSEVPMQSQISKNNGIGGNTRNNPFSTSAKDEKQETSFSWTIAEGCMAHITFSGHVTKEAIRNL